MSTHQPNVLPPTLVFDIEYPEDSETLNSIMEHGCWDTPLYRALYLQDHDEAIRLLDADTDLETLDASCYSLIIHPMNDPVFKFFVQVVSGQRNLINPDYTIPAVIANDMELLDRALSHDPNLSRGNAMGVYHAHRMNRLDLIPNILEYCPNVDKDLLFYAISNGDVQTFNSLFEHRKKYNLTTSALIGVDKLEIEEIDTLSVEMLKAILEAGMKIHYYVLFSAGMTRERLGLLCRYIPIRCNNVFIDIVCDTTHESEDASLELAKLYYEFRFPFEGNEVMLAEQRGLKNLSAWLKDVIDQQYVIV